ncbi:hypothetical protein DI327_22625 [Salmonella enterica subsp. enterica serovar Braenderup]|uniref:Uncharacterized protein n=2 Tax=Enterobacteriaceae TaxID=543 RepID=A0A5P0JH96_ECOLX|nr:protein rep [Escherichia coli]EEE8127273.1 hypothetical protein [Salmonella enterica subsp. enterica serovar Braenderup]EEM9735855.1 hypothetical protein [Salmonella enterica subsp. enterica serovar Braenderup]MQK27403.1 hypothetical protein [Escherichia coli]
MFTRTSVFNKNRSVNRPENLKEFASVNGERITERKKETFNVALSIKDKGEELQDETLTKRAERSLKCSSFRYVATVNGQAQTLYTHRCKGRHCQECQRIKAYIWQKKTESIFPKLEENYLNAKYLFATFTIKNPKITDLRVVLSVMNKAANRLFKMKKYKDFILGGIRSTEITRGKSGADECHPHFHFLLMVKGNYGKKYYVNQEDWGKDWGDCLAYECDKAGYPYNPIDYPRGFPIVDVVRAMDKEKKIEITNKNIKNSGEAIINYVLKYSVKGSDILDHKKGKNDNWFFEFDKQIKGCRMITPVGVFKKYLSEIKKDPFDYDIEKAKIEERLGEGYQVNKAIFKKGDYKLENKKDNEGYLLEALEAKAYNFQQLYLTMYSDYIKFYNDTNREIFKLDNKLEEIYFNDIEFEKYELKLMRLLTIQENRKSSLIQENRKRRIKNKITEIYNKAKENIEFKIPLEEKLGRLLLIQEDRKKRINNTIESLKRVGYLKEEKGLYYDEWGSLWATFEIEKPNIEIVEINDFADMFEVW